jgi:hypothetical protein
MSTNTVEPMSYTMTKDERLAWMSLTGRNEVPATRDEVLRQGREVYERRVAQATPDVEAVLGLFNAAVALGIFPKVDEEQLRTPQNRFVLKSARQGAEPANDSE